MNTSALRLLAALLLLPGLAACGFHLRNAIALPPDLGPVKVQTSSPYSPLAQDLAAGLRVAGAIPAERDQDHVAMLVIESERWGDRPIAVDAEGRAQEYSLRYATVFTFKRADGSELVPRQVVELSRDYVAPPTDVTGTTSEREILADELRRDMAQSILRRIDGVIRGIGRTGTPLDHAPATSRPGTAEPANEPVPPPAGN